VVRGGGMGILGDIIGGVILLSVVKFFDGRRAVSEALCQERVEHETWEGLQPPCCNATGKLRPLTIGAPFLLQMMG
jgi:hypothetical protein